ncbi:MAG TPA: TatD family hydrolase [Chitinophagaceae bacterium]|nr:TatD family hydrolase [Chitinophagaceae bacterium]
MKLIDTHSHLYVNEFALDREQALERAEKQGVIKILLPAIDSREHGALLDLEAAHPGICLAMMGLHPCSVRENYREELDIVEGHLEKRRFIAIGEMGLDFYWDKTFVAEQYLAFQRQAAWARELGIPLVIHSRESMDACIGEVRKMQDGRLRGVFHCFTGTTEQAAQITGLGFHLGIGGVVTFKKSGLDQVLDQVPLEHLVLETDAPYLAPVPMRGKRNESAYLGYIVQKLADIKEMPVAEVAEATTQNAQKLFAC